MNITEAAIFSGKKDDSLPNGANKQALIQLIKEQKKQKGCDVIQAEGDADVVIAKAAISMSSFRPTSLIGEDTDLLVLLPFHTDVSKCTALYFCSDKVKSYVYIKVLCSDLRPSQKCHSKVMHRKEVTHSNGSYERKSCGRKLADEMGRGKKFPWYTHRLMHQKRVTCELHDSYFHLMTIKHVISKIEWAMNYYITQSSSSSTSREMW